MSLLAKELAKKVVKKAINTARQIMVHKEAERKQKAIGEGMKKKDEEIAKNDNAVVNKSHVTMSDLSNDVSEGSYFRNQEIKKSSYFEELK